MGLRGGLEHIIETSISHYNFISYYGISIPVFSFTSHWFWKEKSPLSFLHTGFCLIYHLTVHYILHITSLLYIETADRPGLLVEIIKIIADVNIDVESAEIDTEVWPQPNCFLSLFPCIFCD